MAADRNPPEGEVMEPEVKHPLLNDGVTVEGLKHIQGCPECREWFPHWVPMLDAAEALERERWTDGPGT